MNSLSGINVNFVSRVTVQYSLHGYRTSRQQLAQPATGNPLHLNMPLIAQLTDSLISLDPQEKQLLGVKFPTGLASRCVGEAKQNDLGRFWRRKTPEPYAYRERCLSRLSMSLACAEQATSGKQKLEASDRWATGTWMS